MIKVKINGKDFLVKNGISIIEACSTVGILIPRFCYHENLSIAGNCRMCLVEIEGFEKPSASCLTEILEGQSIYTDSAFVQKARENAVEALLLNHPLDCPICDQAGECDLQDQTKNFGSNFSRFFFDKRGVEDKKVSPLIKTIMTRCIHCTRCVRFGKVAGIDILGTLNRGTSTEIGGYDSTFLDSEIAGNVIDLCPVGALTQQAYSFKARPWELRLSETIDFTDSIGSNICVNYKESAIFRILPKSNKYINQHIISDKTRFSFDSNKKNRITSLFHRNAEKNKLEVSSWSAFYNTWSFINENTTIKKNFVINENIGFNNIESIIKICRTQKNFILSSLNSLVNNTNWLILGLSDKINVIKHCANAVFLFSVNPKTECAVINTRLRDLFQNRLLTVIATTLAFPFNIPTKFVTLDLLASLSIFEGKYSQLSTVSIRSESPLILMSDFSIGRGLNTNEIISFLKAYTNSMKVLKINTSCNSESLSFLNVKNNLLKNNKKTDTFFCFNLDDTFSFRKRFFQFKDFTWFNSHGSVACSKAKVVVPISSEFEDERILINLEQRPQKTVSIFNTAGSGRNLKNILESLEWNHISPVMKSNEELLSPFEFIADIIKTPEIFNYNDPVLTHAFKKNNIGRRATSIYPMKSKIEDFYCSNKETKNSIFMLQSSTLRKKRANNFGVCSRFFSSDSFFFSRDSFNTKGAKLNTKFKSRTSLTPKLRKNSDVFSTKTTNAQKLFVLSTKLELLTKRNVVLTEKGYVFLFNLVKEISSNWEEIGGNTKVKEVSIRILHKFCTNVFFFICKKYKVSHKMDMSLPFLLLITLVEMSELLVPQEKKEKLLLLLQSIHVSLIKSNQLHNYRFLELRNRTYKAEVFQKIDPVLLIDDFNYYRKLIQEDRKLKNTGYYRLVTLPRRVELLALGDVMLLDSRSYHKFHMVKHLTLFPEERSKMRMIEDKNRVHSMFLFVSKKTHTKLFLKELSKAFFDIYPNGSFKILLSDSDPSEDYCSDIYNYRCGKNMLPWNYDDKEPYVFYAGSDEESSDSDSDSDYNYDSDPFLDPSFIDFDSSNLDFDTLGSKDWDLDDSDLDDSDLDDSDLDDSDLDTLGSKDSNLDDSDLDDSNLDDSDLDTLGSKDSNLDS